MDTTPMSSAAVTMAQTAVTQDVLTRTNQINKLNQEKILILEKMANLGQTDMNKKTTLQLELDNLEEKIEKVNNGIPF